jgi:hypothetical protein
MSQQGFPPGGGPPNYQHPPGNYQGQIVQQGNQPSAHPGHVIPSNSPGYHQPQSQQQPQIIVVPIQKEARETASFSLKWFGIAMVSFFIFRAITQVIYDITWHGTLETGVFDAAFGVFGAMWLCTIHLAVLPFGYLFIGMFVGWGSSGRTIMEPAIASGLVAGTFGLYQGFKYGLMMGPYAVCGAIFSFLIAMVGAMIGEKIQDSRG